MKRNEPQWKRAAAREYCKKRKERTWNILRGKKMTPEELFQAFNNVDSLGVSPRGVGNVKMTMLKNR